MMLSCWLIKLVNQQVTREHQVSLVCDMLWRAIDDIWIKVFPKNYYSMRLLRLNLFYALLAILLLSLSNSLLGFVCLTQNVKSYMNANHRLNLCF